jgi:sialate O-acetylesterase
MVNDYRKKWRQPHLPFYWVQLSSIDTAHYKSRYWPLFRDGQRKLLKDIPNSGMAVCSDIGFRDNVHPTDKKAVGERLARWALHDLYGEQILPSGPLPLKAIYHQDTVTIHFQYAKGLHASDGASLRGFSFDGVTTAPAFIRGDTVILVVKERPSTLYYAWQPYTDANLVNTDGLPASTFKLNIL